MYISNYGIFWKEKKKNWCFKNVKTSLISVIILEENLCLIIHYGHKIQNCATWEPKGRLIYFVIIKRVCVTWGLTLLSTLISWLTYHWNFPWLCQL